MEKPLTISEQLALLLGPNAEPRKKSLPLEALEQLSEPVTASERRSDYHIVDITDQFIGKVLIITGTKKPT
jgi:hypothetical protein